MTAQRAVAREDRSPARVLIVEDHVQMRGVLGQMINASGVLVTAHAFARGNDLRTRDVLGGVEVALVDVHLPDTTGIRLATEFSTRTPPVPTVVISGDPNRVDREASLHAGAVAYLSKSIEPAELIEALVCAANRRPVSSWSAPSVHQ